MAAKHKSTITARILIAMISGAILGIVLNMFGEPGFLEAYIVDGVLRVIGSIFVSGLKLLVVPLVFVSLVCGVMALSDVRAVGRIGGKAIAFYLVTTAIAITISLSLAVMTSPGSGLDRAADTSSFQPKDPPSIAQTLIDLVPSNPVAAMANGAMLQIIVFSLIFGIAIAMAGDRGKRVADFFVDLNEIVMKMVSIIMAIAPYGVFCLIAQTFATNGIDLILPLAGYFLTVTAALALHVLIVYTGALRLIGGLSPIQFFRKIRAAMMFAFSTASSSATIPVTIDAVENRMGVRNSVASFTVPLGATINMDGTAIMQGAATVFIANVYGVPLGVPEYLTVILTATLASIGTAGVPGVGLVMLAMVLNQVGLPVEGIALIIGVDRLLDMMRTAVNITGDATVSCLVARSEHAMDEEIFNDPEAGKIEAGSLHLERMRSGSVQST